MVRDSTRRSTGRMWSGRWSNPRRRTRRRRRRVREIDLVNELFSGKTLEEKQEKNVESIASLFKN